MKALKHNFFSTSDVTDLALVVGYQKCLTDMFAWMNEREKEGYLISGNMLADCLLQTTKELKSIVDLTNEIDSLIKPTI